MHYTKYQKKFRQYYVAIEIVDMKFLTWKWIDKSLRDKQASLGAPWRAKKKIRLDKVGSVSL